VMNEKLTIESFRQAKTDSESAGLAISRERVSSLAFAGGNGEIFPEWACTRSRCSTCPLGGSRVFPSRQDFPSARYARSGRVSSEAH